MDTHAKIFCGICDAQHITKTADFWCPECDDGLCSECKTHHTFSKSSRHHAVISIENYRKLPTDISSIVHHCIEHEKKLQIYCPHHDQLCCLICISTSHKECTGMLSIDEMAKTSKSSGLLETLQKSLEDLQSNIDNVVKDRQSNLTKIKEERHNIIAGIQNLRRRIISHFDKIEQEIEKELNASECDLKRKIEDLLHGLKEKQERIAVLQSNIKDLKNHASDLQTFIGIKTLEGKIESEETYVQSLSGDERLKQHSLKCTLNKKIENVLQEITSFGLITIESSPPSVVIKLEKTKEAQIMSACFIPKSIDNIRATLLRKFQIPKGKSIKCNITGCASFPNGKYIFADCDKNKRLLIFNTDGSLDCELHLSGLRPFDIACIDNTTIAFSVYESSEIHFFDIMKKQVSQNKIETNSRCYGITIKDAMIYYGNQEHIGVARRRDNCWFTNVIANLHSFKSSVCYVTAFTDSLYITNRVNNSLCCFSGKGKTVWKYEDNTVLESPTGVTVDRHGIVYVASKKRDCIIAVSPDGKEVVDFLSSADGIDCPFKIICDNERDLLLVAGYHGKCSIFQIK